MTKERALASDVFKVHVALCAIGINLAVHSPGVLPYCLGPPFSVSPLLYLGRGDSQGGCCPGVNLNDTLGKLLLVYMFV